MTIDHKQLIARADVCDLDNHDNRGTRKKKDFFKKKYKQHQEQQLSYF